MEPPEGMTTSRNFDHLHTSLVEAWPKILEFYSATPGCEGRQLIVTCTYRNPEEQNRLFKLGRSKKDGYEKLSKHNLYPSRAIDVCVLDGGKAVWEEEAYWPLMAVCALYGLVSGGSWKNFKDWPHLELKD